VNKIRKSMLFIVQIAW